MATANEMFPATKGDGGQDARYRKVEQFATMTVVGSERSECSGCGERGLIFNCHCFAEEDRPVADLCKACATNRAGGEEKVWVRLDRDGLHETWKNNQRGTSNNPKGKVC